MNTALSAMACEWYLRWKTSFNSNPVSSLPYRYKGTSDLQLERISVYYNETGGM